ncbi:hypothetical protein KSX_50290 [Ktedonospora formicarum]|uniref:Uncharacterized protein n=1 Tax=Ktedonospora formicarum TaxID=2778364 RepID=A0A8J3I138_9CHLR|nr:hypothetical protein KSX_50290 [Ktedonospora formicarum]
MGKRDRCNTAYTGKIKWHWGEKSPNKGATWGPGYPTSYDGILYFFFGEIYSGSQNGLWVLHDGKRDIYPLQR